jgi:hypothetical protein
MKFSVKANPSPLPSPNGSNHPFEVFKLWKYNKKGRNKIVGIERIDNTFPTLNALQTVVGM